MSLQPAPPPPAAPAIAIDPRVERLDAWWREMYVLVVRDCHAFLTQLPRLKREAQEMAAGGNPADLACVATTTIPIAEGIAHWAKQENDAAELALTNALHALEKILPEISMAGLAQLTRRLIGNCHAYLGHVAHNRGDYAEALRCYLSVRDLALFGGFTVMLYHGLAGVSMIYGETGMWEKQIELAREARRIGESINNEVALAQLDVMVAAAYRKLRDFAAARQVWDRAIEIFRRHGWKGEELDALIRVALLDLDEQKPADAIRRLHELEALSGEVNRPHFEAARLVELGRASLAMGDFKKAAAVLESVIERFAPEMGVAEHADAQLVLARTRLAGGNCAAAASEAGEALQLLARTGLPHESEADAHALMAEAAQAGGDWMAACRAERARHDAYVRHFNHQADLRTRLLAVEHQIDVARATAERERVERQRLEELLADLAQRLEKADAVPRARSAEEISPDDLRPLGLTVRESEILLWVARGKTNDEIAIILGCAAETVKSHLKRIYQQLDVTNRAAAAAAALQPPPAAATGGKPAGRKHSSISPIQGTRRK